MAFEDDVNVFAAGVNAELPKRIIIVRGADANGDPTTRSEPEVATLTNGSMYFQEDSVPNKKLWVKYGPNQADWQPVADESRLQAIEDALDAISDELDLTQLTGAGLLIDGNYDSGSVSVSNYLTSSVSIHNATLILDNELAVASGERDALDARITSEVAIASGDRDVIRGDVAQEILDRVQAINDLTQYVDDEFVVASGERETLRTDLQTNIDTVEAIASGERDLLDARITVVENEGRVMEAVILNDWGLDSGSQPVPVNLGNYVADAFDGYTNIAIYAEQILNRDYDETKPIKFEYRYAMSGSATDQVDIVLGHSFDGLMFTPAVGYTDIADSFIPSGDTDVYTRTIEIPAQPSVTDPRPIMSLRLQRLGTIDINVEDFNLLTTIIYQE